MRSSLFGWKSSDITDAECPVNVRIEQPCCKNQFHGINYEIQKTEKQLNAILCCNYSFEENKGRHLICSQMFRIIMHDAHHLLTPFHIKEQMLWAFTKYNHEQGLLTAFFVASHHNQIHSFSGKGQCKASLDFKIKMSNATYH